jgi:hypothetical protein
MYPTGHLSLAKEPSMMPHYMSVLIIGPENPVGQVSLLVPHDVPDPLCEFPVPLHVTHIHPGHLREVLVLCAPDGVLEHLKEVHLQFLDLTKTGKNIHFGSFFKEVIIHDLMMQNKTKSVSTQNSLSLIGLFYLVHTSHVSDRGGETHGQVNFA